MQEEREARRVELVVSNRTILRLLAIAAAFVTLLYVCYLVREVLLLGLISLFLALILNPAVTALERRLGWKRQPAVLTVYLSVTVVVVGFVAAVLTPLIRELTHFLDHLPDYVDQLERSQLFRDADRRYKILDQVRTNAKRLSSEAPNVGTGLLGIAGKIVTAVIGAVTIFFLTLFLLLELPRIARSLHQLLPPEKADRAERIALEVNTTVARYAAGALVIATIAGVVTWTTLTLLGVPFAIVLALLVAFFDLIPLVGATVGAILAVAVAFTHSTSAGVTMLVVHLVYQQVENHVLQPMVGAALRRRLPRRRDPLRARRGDPPRRPRRPPRDPDRGLDPGGPLRDDRGAPSHDRGAASGPAGRRSGSAGPRAVRLGRRLRPRPPGRACGPAGPPRRSSRRRAPAPRRRATAAGGSRPGAGSRRARGGAGRGAAGARRVRG